MNHEDSGNSRKRTQSLMHSKDFSRTVFHLAEEIDPL